VLVPGSVLAQGKISAARLLQVTGLSPSSSEARRLISQGGVSLGEDKARVETHDTPIAVIPGLLLWVGKKRVVRLAIGPN
jgi:tyrosyl-tRNA synthetase